MEERKRSKAGTYAWRMHKRKTFPWLLLILAPMLVYPALLLIFVVPGKLGFWSAHLIFLPVVGVAILANREANARNMRWGDGARGEFRVGEEIEKLHIDGYHVFHDWYSGWGNVDHFAVGSQGVFAIETKAWTGEITYENGTLLRNGRRVADENPLAQARKYAAKVSELVEKSRGLKVWVRPILCFSRAELRYYGIVEGVELTDLGALRRTVLEKPEIYPHQRTNSISYFLERHLGVAPAAKPGLPPSTPGRLKKLLRPERIFVAAYVVYLLALSLVFAGSTATIFEWAAEFYRFLESVIGIGL